MGVTFGNSEESVPLSIGRRLGVQLQRARMPGPLGNSLHSIISTDLQASLFTREHQPFSTCSSHESVNRLRLLVWMQWPQASQKRHCLDHFASQCCQELINGRAWLLSGPEQVFSTVRTQL